MEYYYYILLAYVCFYIIFVAISYLFYTYVCIVDYLKYFQTSVIKLINLLIFFRSSLQP